jgi:hypothetical protein
MKGETDRLKAELRLAKQTLCTVCTVCLVRPAQIAEVPCGHSMLCTSEECLARVDRHPVSRCPLCREPMTGTLRVF